MKLNPKIFLSFFIFFFDAVFDFIIAERHLFTVSDSSRDSHARLRLRLRSLRLLYFSSYFYFIYNVYTIFFARELQKRFYNLNLRLIPKTVA